MCVCVYPEGNLQILSSPDVHASIIRADLLEVISVYGEQAPRHGGGPGEGGREGEESIRAAMETRCRAAAMR